MGLTDILRKKHGTTGVKNPGRLVALHKEERDLRLLREKIYNLRQDSSITGDEISERTGMSIPRIEFLETNPWLLEQMTQLARIVRARGMSITQLFEHI